MGRMLTIADSMRGRAFALWASAILLLEPLFFAHPSLALIKESIQIQTFGSHGRIAIAVDPTVKSSLKSEGKSFELLLEGLLMVDLGLEEGLIRSSDSRLEAVQVRDTDKGILISGRFKFPSGDQAPLVPKMDLFEYRQTHPPALVVDFWPKAGPTVGQARAEAFARKKRLQLEKSRRIARKTQDIRSFVRKPAGEGFSFCSHPLSDKTDTFVHFSPFHQSFPFEQYLPFNRPDRDYPYLRVEEKSEAGDLARLALELYQTSRPALALKTIEFFEKSHSSSPLLPEMRFIGGNALHRLGKSDAALQAFKDIVTRFPQSPQALFSAIYLVAQALERKDTLEQVERFLWLAKNHPQHRLHWVFRMGMAEALAKIREVERAQKEYQWVIDHAEEVDQQAQAAYRIGDMYMVRGQYEQAVTAYVKALNLYPKQKDEFPSLYVNRAESYYWLGEYDRSRKEFEAFLKSHPSHPAGWRASFRIGEIVDRKLARGSKESTEFYLRTVNQYPHSPGATLARMRLLPCGDHGGFNLETADRFLKVDAQSILTSEDVEQRDMVDFMAMTKALTYQTLGAPAEAVEIILGELKRKPSDTAVERLRLAFLISARLKILHLLKDGKKFEALSFYKANAVYFPDQSATEGSSKYAANLEDFDFLLQLSQAAVELGLAPMGKELLTLYRKHLDKDRNLASLKGAELDIAQLIERSDVSFTEAHSLWLAGGLEHEGRIRELLGKVPDESKAAVEKHAILALMEERKGNTSSSILAASKAGLLAASREPAVRAQIGFYSAELYRKNGKFALAYGQLKQIEGLGEATDPLLTSIGMPKIPGAEAQMYLRAEMLEKDSNWAKAAEEYSAALASGMKGNRLLYGYAMALEKSKERGSDVKVRGILEKIVGSEESDFWKNLAKEALENRTKEGT